LSSYILFIYVVAFAVAIYLVYRATAKRGSRDELKSRGGGPGCIHCIKDFALYHDRLQTPHGTAYFSDGPVRATVDTAGNLAVGRRATLTRMAAGGLLFGALGAVVAGAGFKKDKRYDERELYLLVEAPKFASIGEFEPEYGAQVREFTVDLHNAYIAWQRSAAEDEDDDDGIEAAPETAMIGEAGTKALPSAVAQPPSVADELEKLAALRDRGVLTEEEFSAQKNRLLG
jgi:hypothetical protein